MLSTGGVSALSHASHAFTKKDATTVRLTSTSDSTKFSGSSGTPAATPAKKANIGILSGLLLCGGGIVALLATAVGIVGYGAFSLISGGIRKVTGLFSSNKSEEDNETKPKAKRK
jgi:hypothetical protein